MNVYKAISKVSARLAKEGIGKDRKNQTQGYNFRGIDDVYNALAPILADEGLCILPKVTSREVVERTTKSGTALFYVTVQVEFSFVCAEDGSSHVITTYGEAMDSGDKATNKAMSAAYKYACMQAFCIPTEGDNDADATTHAVAARPVSSISAAAVKQDAFDDLEPDEKVWITDLADAISAMVGTGAVKDAADEIDHAIPQVGEKRLPKATEYKVALWGKLDSKTRTALTKYRNSLKEAA